MYIEDDIDGIDIGKMRYPCIQFNNDERFSFADGPFYSKLARIDEQFCESQQFESKAQLKIKLVEFHIEQNMKLEVQNYN
jgi:hypothetical protein